MSINTLYLIKAHIGVHALTLNFNHSQNSATLTHNDYSKSVNQEL